jgi:carbon-monoxide dehydrogenase medium subunit
VTAARVAVTGLGPRAVRLTSVEKALVGQGASAASASAAAAKAADGLELYDDAKGSAAYKANLARVFTARALSAALGA